MSLNKLLRKKRFRLKRLLFPLISVALIAVAVNALLTDDADDLAESPAYRPMNGPNEQEQHVFLLKDSNSYTVLKKLKYVCGEETESLGKMSGAEILALLEQHRDWELTWGADGSAILEESVDDLSPGCKGNVYFGLDADGNLALFEGKPEENKVLQTFFQIDIEYLESSLPRQSVENLYDGIRIHNYAQYNSVLSTFAGFAVEAEPQ